METVQKALKTDSADKSRIYEMYLKQARIAQRRGPVQKDMTIQLVNDAIGVRSMSKFAAELGVNVSSISRILSGKVQEISSELLAKIATYAAPDSGVTLERLMDAQGLYARADTSASPSWSDEVQVQIIVNELLKRGYLVSFSSLFLANNKTRVSAPPIVITDAIARSEGRWELSVSHVDRKGKALSNDLSSWLNRCMAEYYQGTATVGRYTRIYDLQAHYEKAKAIISDIRIPDEISIMLVSTEERRVLEEYIIPLSNGQSAKSIFQSQEGGDTNHADGDSQS